VHLCTDIVATGAGSANYHGIVDREQVRLDRFVDVSTSPRQTSWLFDRPARGFSSRGSFLACIDEPDNLFYYFLKRERASSSESPGDSAINALAVPARRFVARTIRWSLTERRRNISDVGEIAKGIG